MVEASLLATFLACSRSHRAAFSGCVADRAKPRMAASPYAHRTLHAHLIRSLGLWPVPGAADRRALGHFADQAQAGVAGDGPGDRDLVPADRVGGLSVRLSGGDPASAEPACPRAARWLAGTDGGARPGGQLRVLPD